MTAFSYFIARKSIDLSCSLNGSFTHVWFFNSMPWSFGKYQFTTLGRSSKCWLISLANIQKNPTKIHLLMSPLILSKKVFKCWKTVKLVVADIGFSKTLIFIRKLKFYHSQQIMSNVFSWSDSLHLFLGKFLSSRLVRIAIICLIVLSSKNGATPKKCG